MFSSSLRSRWRRWFCSCCRGCFLWRCSCCRRGWFRRMAVFTSALDHHINAAFIFLDDWHSATRRLQQSREFCFDKATLFLRIANMTQRWSHIKRAAGLALGEYVVSAQMYFCELAGSTKLLQVSVAKLSLCIFLIANRLRI